MPVRAPGSTSNNPPHSTESMPSCGATAARRTEPGVWAVPWSRPAGPTMRMGGYVVTMSWVAFVRAACAGGAGELQGALQVILDLRQGLAGKFLEVRVAAVLDLLLEQRCIAFLILDLAVHIVLVERGAVIGIEREQHRVISAVQQRVRRRDMLALQDLIQRIDDGNMRGDHQGG